MTHTLIYPHTTAHNAAGHLEIGGCDVVDLAREFGTPLFIYDEQTLRDQCRAYATAFAARADDFEIEKKVILEEIRMYEDQPPFGADESWTARLRSSATGRSRPSGRARCR